MTLLFPAVLFLAGAFQGELPTGYVDDVIVSGLDSPVALAHDDSGQMYVSMRRGLVHLVENGAVLSPPLLDISEEVDTTLDLGMCGFVLDPDFAVNGYFYVFYVVDRHHLMNFGTPAYDPAQDDHGAATIGRVTRFTADASNGFKTLVAGSRFVLLGETPDSGVPILHLSHGVGTLAFGEDGTLLAGTGDGASFYTTDTGSVNHTYYAQALADGIIRPAENVGAFRSQLVNCLSGKVLRLDPATGDGIPSNPFYDPAAPRSPRSRVWTLGSRNAFRFSVKPGSGQSDPAVGDPGTLYIGDVGWNTFEELHIVENAAENLGWPIFEGLEENTSYLNSTTANLDAPNPLYDGTSCTQQFFDFQDLLKQEREDHQVDFPNPCDGTVEIASSTPTFMHRRSIVEWRHNNPPRAYVPVFDAAGLAEKVELGTPTSPVHGESFRGTCSVGGFWHSGAGFGDPYNGAYFFADWSLNWIRALEFENGEELHEVLEFGEGIAKPVFLGEDPADGSLLYLSWAPGSDGSIHRIRFTGDSNLAPHAAVHVDPVDAPNHGAYTLVQLDGTGSHDPEGGLLDFLWTFADGSTSTLPSPLLTLNNPGGAPAHSEVDLIVTDSSGAMDLATERIPLGNTPPRVSITGAVNGSYYSNNQETLLNLQAVATDAEHSTQELSFRWEVFLHHSSHEHLLTEASGSTLQVALSPAPSSSVFYANRVLLTVTDPEGLEATSALWFFPRPSVTGLAKIRLPQAGSVYDLGDSIAIDVETSGVLTRVDFYVDGVMADSDFSAPFNFQYTPEKSGSPVLHLIAHVAGEGIANSLGVPIVIRPPALGVHGVQDIADDALESLAGTLALDAPVLNLGTSRLDPTLVGTAATGPRSSIAGIRVAVDAPQGAKILSAHLQFTAHDRGERLTLLRVRAEASDDAPAILAVPGNLSSRPTTTAEVDWQVPSWNYVGARGASQRTPELSELLQEVVDRPGWQAGAHVLFLIDGSGQRRTQAFAGSGFEAAQLLVEFVD